jgi:hypothetical protein
MLFETQSFSGRMYSSFSVPGTTSFAIAAPVRAMPTHSQMQPQPHAQAHAQRDQQSEEALAQK